MSQKKLSLCMIVRDEAKHLPECLQGIDNLVDEIIIVDTGSRDNTPDIARQMGARVYSIPWTNDFSAARNESLAHATGDWILVLDADEVLDPLGHDQICMLVEKGTADAYRLEQRTYQLRPNATEWISTESGDRFSRGCPGYIPSPLVRLFRNLPSVRFKGKVHELVENDLITQNRSIVDTDIPIHHYGKITGSSRIKRKQALYCRIGEEKLRHDPTNARNMLELGIQYLELNQVQKSVEVLGRAWNENPNDPKIGFNFAAAIAKQGRNEEALSIYQRILELDPTHAGALNNLAQLEHHAGRVPKAEEYYRQALDQYPDHHILHFNYGLLLENTGRRESAVNHYQEALRVDPKFGNAKTRLESIASQKEGPNPEILNQKPSSVSGLSSSDDSRIENVIQIGCDFMEREMWLEALEVFADALEMDSNCVALRYQAGYALEKSGKKDAAMEQYQEALRLEPRHPKTLLRLALEAENQDLIEDAITLYKEILKADPDHPEANRKLILIDGETNLTKVETVGKPLTIAFVWGGPPFSGDTIDRKPLGGTETAMIHMARTLASSGNHVRVFVPEGNGANFSNVRYVNINNYSADLEQTPIDVLIAARTFHPFVNAPSAKVRVFWTEDAFDQPFLKLLSRNEIIEGIHRIFTVSHWQTQTISETFKIPMNKFYITRNGICWNNFEDLPPHRNHKKLVYTSTPFRGLDVLLNTFPRIRAQIPEAELDIYSSMAVYQVAKDQDEARFGDLYGKADQPGVCMKGSILQKDLAEALKKAGLMTYPNHFAETSCIAAMEAMAAGLPVVATELGALPETVGEGGILIPGDPRSESYQDAFVEAVCELMNNPQKWQAISQSGRNKAAVVNRWEAIAEEWEAEFLRLLRPTSQAVSIQTNEKKTPSGSPEQQMSIERLPKNQEPLDPYFGRFLQLMRQTLSAGGSEYGLGINLFALAVAINASEIIEIGRFKGFATLALASALKLLDIGWEEPQQHKQRPDIDYKHFEKSKRRILYSIDPFPTQEAEHLIREAELTEYVDFIDQPSESVNFNRTVDLLFIDGDHGYEGCMRDVNRFVPERLRPGGYFVLHDYFGWYDPDGKNKSPIKQVTDELIKSSRYEHLLMDTGYQSYVVFRKPS